VNKIRNISLSVVTIPRDGRLGFRTEQKQGLFLYATASRPALGPNYPPIHWVSGAFPGSKVAGALSWPLIPSSDEFNYAWSCSSTPHYVFMPWSLVKHRDNFTFY